MALDLYRDWGEGNDMNNQEMRDLRRRLKRCNGIIISSFVELQGLLKLKIKAATVYLYTRNVEVRSLVEKAINEHNLLIPNKNMKVRFLDLSDVDNGGRTTQRFTWEVISKYVLDYYDAKEALCKNPNDIDLGLRYVYCNGRMGNILATQLKWDHILTMACQILPMLEMCKTGWQGCVWISFEAADAVRAAALHVAEFYGLNWRFIEKSVGLENLYQILMSIENIPSQYIEMDREREKRDWIMNSYKGRKFVLVRNAEQLLAIQPMAIMAYFQGTAVIPHGLNLDSELMEVMTKQGITFYQEVSNTRGYSPNPSAPSIDSLKDLMAIIDTRTAGELSEAKSYLISPLLYQEIQEVIVEECFSRDIKLSSTKLRYMFI